MSKPSAYIAQHGFPKDQRATVAALFWEAFKAKLGLLMRPEETALQFLTQVADPSHALSVLDDEGTLLGVAGFKTDTGSFVGGGLSDLAQAYGWLGALWRAVGLSLLERDLQPGVLTMDGIFVAPHARGLGIGTTLLQAIKTEAAAQGCHAVRLDVIDINPRARALYEREGFVAQKTKQIGPLRHLFGFQTATEMRFALSPVADTARPQ
ncbi:Acetyltransferase (GNAT) family protein [Celeribacter baekdonensis]|uniref:Acetyltransferase (GNAT) family protein n=1 Tax=Celeribacter baekdonensis TaxID=875171 RepID=A0A1G7G9T5_9RHOB|nr:GNAT family N-acetyltransferase [Celeribacter baekdonensis]SDE84853.1 Acetyltransferase (GNAT) family protein [Celeribacter baekdonensis]